MKSFLIDLAKGLLLLIVTLVALLIAIVALSWVQPDPLADSWTPLPTGGTEGPRDPG